ncbi:CAP domain-containing protein [Streptomyces sp. NPDC096012]|uniref:CAP domain-containing protein n=1 Tax=Streptomyces sp. NPDC096012 TaxID=3155684 RepID=UPI00336A1507
MGQHRRTTHHYRRIVITAVAIGTVGVPSVALACSDWPYGGQDPSSTAATAPVEPANTPGLTTYIPGQQPTPAGQQPTAAGQQPMAAGQQPTATGQQGAPTQEPSVPTQSPGAPAHQRHHTHRQHREHRQHHRAGHDAGVPRTTAPTEPGAAAQQGAGAKTAAPKPAPSTPEATASAPAAPAAPSTSKPTATASGVTAQIVQLVNAERAKAGCQDLTLNPELTKAAQAHSADMAAHQNMSHTGSDGSAPGDRITRAGYTWSSYGENVAYGYATAEQVMAGWMSSPGHRANILNCSFKEIGVGLAQPNSYWTQDFGTPR